MRIHITPGVRASLMFGDKHEVIVSLDAEDCIRLRQALSGPWGAEEAAMAALEHPAKAPRSPVASVSR